METPVRDRAVDADKGYRTYRYGKGEADDHSLDEQAEIHETPGSGTIGRRAPGPINFIGSPAGLMDQGSVLFC